MSSAKAKRKEARAAKTASKPGSAVASKIATPADSANGSMQNSRRPSIDGLNMEQANIRKNERSVTGVLTSQEMSRDIKIESFNLNYHGRLLIENATIELNYPRRYGLLGANGSGKTTFLESLAARDIAIPSHIEIFLLNSEAEPSEMNALDYIIYQANKRVEQIEREIEELSAIEPLDEIALAAKYEQLDDLDPNTFEVRASIILSGLGFVQDMMKKPTKDMSGGWRMRVALGQALFIKPALLLLDEPTNHLDLEAVVWLETYLAGYPHCLVVNSHSQDFLNNVCNEMMDLTLDKKLEYYGGNFDTYVRTKSEKETNQTKAYHKQQEEIAHIKKFIASAGTYANLVRQAKSKQKIIDKMEAAGLIRPVLLPPPVNFKFNDMPRLPPPVIAFNDVAFAYNDKVENYLYQKLSFGIDMDSRVAIVGKNGTGKSTLLNLITGLLSPSDGTVQKHPGLKLGKYSQHSADQLPFEKSPLEHFESTFKPKFPDKDIQFWRSQIGRFGLSGTHQTSRIETLSDGLKARVVFAQLALESPHILLLDEPTNHLDIPSIDALAKACKEFTGGVVLVSHDFRLISQVANELWEVKNKNVTKLDMTIEQYKQTLVRESRDALNKVKQNKY